MAGLLDGFGDFIKTPEGQGLLAAVMGGMAGAQKGTPWNNLGRAGLAGVTGYGNAMDRDTHNAQLAQQKKMQDQTYAHQQMQMDAATRQQAQDQAMRDAAKAATFTPEQAIARGMGPTMDGGPVPEVSPGFNNEQYIQSLFRLGAPDKAIAFQQAVQKDNTPLTVAPGASLVDKKTFKKLFTAPKEIDPNKPFMVVNGQIVPNKAYQDFDFRSKKAGATSVNVNSDNLGLKPKERFDMEDKMRNDYSTATKNDSEIIGTAQDLKNILKQGGALKDQAAIYKFAKSLDPQGAVREADYAAIVKTAGGLDYVTAIVNKALTGEQLSPNQRKEMASLMDAMASVAQQRVAKVQKRYGANAKMYNLKPENIFQQQSESEDGWGIAPGGKQ